MANERVPTIVWMVLVKRSDGKPPHMVKNLADTVYFTIEEARNAMQDINKSLGYQYYGVFRCLVDVCEIEVFDDNDDLSQMNVFEG